MSCRYEPGGLYHRPGEGEGPGRKYRLPNRHNKGKPYFVDYLINIELARYFNNSTDDIYRSGLEIYTTLMHRCNRQPKRS